VRSSTVELSIKGRVPLSPERKVASPRNWYPRHEPDRKGRRGFPVNLPEAKLSVCASGPRSSQHAAFNPSFQI